MPSHVTSREEPIARKRSGECRSLLPAEHAVEREIVVKMRRFEATLSEEDANGERVKQSKTMCRTARSGKGGGRVYYSLAQASRERRRVGSYRHAAGQAERRSSSASGRAWEKAMRSHAKRKWRGKCRKRKPGTPAPQFPQPKFLGLLSGSLDSSQYPATMQPLALKYAVSNYGDHSMLSSPKIEFGI